MGLDLHRHNLTKLARPHMNREQPPKWPRQLLHSLSQSYLDGLLAANLRAFEEIPDSKSSVMWSLWPSSI